MLKSDLTRFEPDVLEWLLSGNDVVLDALRKQLGGFPVKPDFYFGDVEATIDSLKYGAGFLLWVKDSLLDSLEGYAYEEKWPIVIDSFQWSWEKSITHRVT